MKSLFGWLTSLSIRFRVVTLVLALIVSVLSAVAITQLQQELIPPIEFPQVVILSQVSGMESEEVLAVLTNRLEDALAAIDDIVNIESTTTGAFGSVIIARNEFGLDQARLRETIRQRLDEVWLPIRRIEPAAGQDPQAFADELLADLTPEVLIYLADRDPNFLFQLNQDVWQSFSDETVETVLAYLAAQTEDTQSIQNALQNLVEQEIVPQLELLDVVADIQISGGQTLPGDTNGGLVTAAPIAEEEAPSLLLKLSADVWEVVSARVTGIDTQDETAVAALRATTVEIPATPPPLPPSWQIDGFTDTSDLWEMRSLTRTIANVLNDFRASGRISGGLGQTNDLTPEIVTRMLDIAPTLANHFEAEHLAAMSEDVFAVLPEDFINNLDGFTRDELAAAALAESMTGQDVVADPVPLPSAWRVQQPSLISFSLDDIPLASFSVSGTENGQPAGTAVSVTETSNPDPDEANDNSGEVEASNPSASTNLTDIPEGPPLPPIFALLGLQFGTQLDTADDLINLALPEEMAAQLGGAGTLSAADLLNFMIMLSDPDAQPEGVEMPSIPLDARLLIAAISPEAIGFIAEYDSTFVANLTPAVFEAFSDGVLALPALAPPLPDVWDTLARQPEFTERPLASSRDLLALGAGAASDVLNTINAEVPSLFSGYEIRLLNSLSTANIRYLVGQEPDFFSHLDIDVLVKLSPEVLALLPEDFLATLDEDTAGELMAIANGEQPSAAAALAELYTTNIAPADPDAPSISGLWPQVGTFYGIEMDSADDFFRFPEGFPFASPGDFMNSFFDSPQGAAVAPQLFGALDAGVVAYVIDRDPTSLDTLRAEALQFMPADALALLPEALQGRAVSGGEPFTPTATITRTNGFPSLQLTVYKTSNANTVAAFHTVEAVLQSIDEADNRIAIDVAFEQASFIEESISGVAREGGLGAMFAVIVILAFLSNGVWARRPRRTAAIVIMALFVLLLLLIVMAGTSATNGDLSLAYAQADPVIRVLLIAGAVIGLAILLWPRDIPRPAWRSTLVTGMSIPLSILMAMALMRWMPPLVHNLVAPGAADSAILAFLARLFPASITLNIMTLSGLTVAIGRVVDDSIVVLENIFRHIQEDGDRRTAVIQGAKDVSVAIFAATAITVVVFLPLGLTGGIIGEFFLPFGLAVTYALGSSFIVAITVVPVLAYMLIEDEETQEEGEGWLTRLYLPALQWALRSRRNQLAVLAVCALSLVVGMALFAGRPVAFLPDLGEPQISVTVDLPSGTRILETNALVNEFENTLQEELDEESIGVVQTIVGGGGLSMDSVLGGGSGVTENAANLNIGIESPDVLDTTAQEVRAIAERIFGTDHVTVSAGSLTSSAFSAFALVLSGPQDVLAAIDALVIETLNGVEGITNVSSNLTQVGGTTDDGPTTYIRVDRESAVRYTGELETENTIGVVNVAITTLENLDELPDTITISQGFESEIQTEGFQSLAVAMLIAIGLVILLLIATFGSLVHWLDIMLSVLVAPVGAAVALTLTDRVLGISAMIGLLMLIGIVVTNAVVLIDRVLANRRERKMPVTEALLEGGGRRLRPILMTAVATIFALIPLAVGLSEGAIIASELGTVVIGGLFSSTLLTLFVVPVAYSLLNPLHERVGKLFGNGHNRND